MKLHLQDKVAVVTGASKGIGLATAAAPWPNSAGSTSSSTTSAGSPPASAGS
jgi:hypothetical protein